MDVLFNKYLGNFYRGLGVVLGVVLVVRRVRGLEFGYWFWGVYFLVGVIGVDWMLVKSWVGYRDFRKRIVELSFVVCVAVFYK